MTNRRNRILGSSLVLLVFGTAWESQASIQVTGTSLVVVNAIESSTSSGSFAVAAAAKGDREFNLIDGTSTNTTRYTISDSVIKLEFDQFITGQEGSRALSELIISFRSTIDVPFVLSGFYAASDPEGREMGLAARLSGDSLAIDMGSLSESTPDESLDVGVAGGDTFNRVQGSLTGILLANTVYSLEFIATLRSQSARENGARAGGQITLAFVPEPGTALLVGLGLVGLASRRRPRRERAAGASSPYSAPSPATTQ